MLELPAGAVTLLLTDVEGSTTRWERAPEAMIAQALGVRVVGERVERNVALIQAALEQADFVAALAKGRAMSTDEAIAYALDEAGEDAPTSAS